MSDDRSLVERMAAATASLKPVPKNGSMTLGGKPTPYVRNDDLMDELRGKLAAQGVQFLPTLDHVEDAKGGVRAYVKMRFAAGSETIEAMWAGDGRELAIATTYAVKYYLMKTFLVGSGDEDDEVAQGDRPKQQAQNKPSKPAQNKPAPPPPPAGNGSGNGRQAIIDRIKENFWYPRHGVKDESGFILPEPTWSAIKAELTNLVSLVPGIVAVAPDGSPDLKGSSNEQLSRLLQHYEEGDDPNAVF